MALVKCTKQVYEHAISEIDTLFSDRLVEAYKLRGITIREIADYVYKSTHTPERLTAIQDIESIYEGHKLLYNSESMRFTLSTNSSPVISRQFDIKLTPPRNLLHAFSVSYGPAAVLKNASYQIEMAIIEAHNRREAVLTDKKNFKDSFDAAWKKVKSLNELVKAWPAVTELLTSEVITRINRKTGPRTKKEEVIDASSLNVQLLKAKVAK